MTKSKKKQTLNMYVRLTVEVPASANPESLCLVLPDGVEVETVSGEYVPAVITSYETEDVRGTRR